MGKAAAIAGMGAGGTALSVGSAYMFGGFGSKQAEEAKEQNQEDKNLEIPVSLSEFQDKDKGKKIINSYFEGITWESNTEGKEGKDNDKPDTSSFLGAVNANSKGRLVVNWEKFKCSPEQSDNWSGKIRWLWTFVNGDNGMVLYASAKSSASAASKLDIEGIIYAIEKEGSDSNKSGKIKYHKKTATNNTTVDAWENKLPEVGEKLKANLKVKEYGGFTSGTDKLTKLCKLDASQNDTATPTSQFKGSGVGQHENGKDEKPLAWSKDNHQGLDSVYGATDPKLETLVQSFSGVGKEESFDHKQLGVGEAQST